MDNLNRKENVKGVRLQGFKGFKLKNTQILFKTSFPRKGLAGKSHDKRSSHISKLTTASTLPSLSSFVSSGTNEFSHEKVEKTPQKNVDVAYFFKANTPVKKFSPKISLTSTLKNHDQCSPNAVDTRINSPSKKDVNLSRKRELTSHDPQLPIKCRRAISPQSSLSKSNLHVTSKKKHSDDDDDDDDEVLRKIREKRRLNKKISETYTPQKKKEENEICQQVTINHAIERENNNRLKSSEIASRLKSTSPSKRFSSSSCVNVENLEKQVVGGEYISHQQFILKNAVEEQGFESITSDATNNPIVPANRGSNCDEDDSISDDVRHETEEASEPLSFPSQITKISFPIDDCGQDDAQTLWSVKANSSDTSNGLPTSNGPTNEAIHVNDSSVMNAELSTEPHNLFDKLQSDLHCNKATKVNIDKVDEAAARIAVVNELPELPPIEAKTSLSDSSNSTVTIISNAFASFDMSESEKRAPVHPVKRRYHEWFKHLEQNALQSSEKSLLDTESYDDANLMNVASTQTSNDDPVATKTDKLKDLELVCSLDSKSLNLNVSKAELMMASDALNDKQKVSVKTPCTSSSSVSVDYSTSPNCKTSKPSLPVETDHKSTNRDAVQCCYQLTKQVVSSSTVSVQSSILNSNSNMHLNENGGEDSSKPQLNPVPFGDDSPVIDYSMSDDQSSLSGVEALSPIDIRIPVDNDNTVKYLDSQDEVPDKEINVERLQQTDATEGSPALSEYLLPSADCTTEETIPIKTQDVNCDAEQSTVDELPIAVEKDSVKSQQVNQESIELRSSTEHQPSVNHGESNKKLSEFEMINENIYLFQKKKSRARKEIRRMLCECVSNLKEDEPPCGESCLNRLLMIECSARCPNGEACTNKRFQRGQYLPTEVFETSWKGKGLRAADTLPSGKLVMEYCGEVLDPIEFYRRSQFYAENNQQHFYFMALSQDEVIDATYKGNNSRFINHSCDPNCETQKWTVNGRLRVGFFTLKEVKKGEEITFDYQFERYGKEAQKCYCGAPKCRGYLGKPRKNYSIPFISDDVIEQMVAVNNTEKEKKVRNKINRLQEFSDNTLENEISRLLSGLQTTKEVLLLSRLMVRSETIRERLMCLKVIRKSDNQASLKAFLHFHGLPLIWSWMVDATGNNSVDCKDVLSLKTEILNTLSMLPINNRNILEDSKVLAMVKRWADGNSDMKINHNEQKMKEHDESEKIEMKERGEEYLQLSEKLVHLATSLLRVWKNLKEIYRIPKRSKPAETTQGGNNELSGDDKSRSQTSSPQLSKSQSRNKDEREKSPIRNRPSYREGRHREHDLDRKHRRSPVKHRYKEDEFDNKQAELGNKYAWLEGSSSARLSREEHRKQFELEMKNKKIKKQEVVEYTTTSQPTSAAAAAAAIVSSSVVALSSTTSAYSKQVQQPVMDTTTFTPSGYSGNLIQINPTPFTSTPSSFMSTSSVTASVQMQSFAHDSNLLSTNYLNPSVQPINMLAIPPTTPPSQISPFINQPFVQTSHQLPPTFPPQQATATNEGVTVLGYHGANVIVMLTPEQLKELTDLLAFKSLQQASSNLPLQLPTPVQLHPPIVPDPTPPSLSPLPSVQNELHPSIDRDRPSTDTPSETSSNVTTSKSPSKDPRSIPHSLPPNWKTASDADGCVYYYHAITRQTQWDPPTWDAPAEDLIGKKEGDMEISTPVDEEATKKTNDKLSSTAIVASDAEQARKAKEAFRSRMSQHIVTCLSAYRKSDCKVGRITSNEDFKRLARKLTYNILMKEIKQVQVWEDLECNANVKHKAKEYVRKYMAKMGPVYKGKEDESAR